LPISRDDVPGIRAPANGLSPHVRFLPCGTTWDWDGTRFGALGGAVSVNRAELVENETWWSDELVANVPCRDSAPARSMCSSRTMRHCRRARSGTRYVASNSAMQPICEMQRALVDQAMRATGARLVVHGHHQVGYDETIRWAADVDASSLPVGWVETRVVGMGCESWDSIAVLDTWDRSVTKVCPDAAARSLVSLDDRLLPGSRYEERRRAGQPPGDRRVAVAVH
jgi:hypothetical protein